MEWYDAFRVLSLVTVWAIPAMLIVAVVVFVVAAPALTFAGIIGRLYETASIRLREKTPVEMQGANLVCSVDVDCPPGFICVNGYCVPQKGQ